MSGNLYRVTSGGGLVDQPARSAEPATYLAEGKIREQDRLFDIAVNNMSQGLVMFDAAERLLVRNQRYLEMYGLSPEAVKPGCTLLEMLQHRIDKGTFARDPLQYRADLLMAMSEGRTVQTVTETGDGRVIAVVNQPMEGGGWVATHEDITERRRAEEDRDRTKAFLDTVIENVPVTLVVKDARDHRYVLINRAAEELGGLTRSEVIGKSAHELFAKDEADLIEARDAEVLQSGHQLLIDEQPMHTPRNGTRLVTSKRLAIMGPSGEPEYVLSVIEDITEKRHAEERIAHLAHHDPLTDLPNRAAFNEHLNAAVMRATQSGEPFTLLAIDLDRFKEVNDVFGHAVGDDLLREVSRMLQELAGERLPGAARRRRIHPGHAERRPACARRSCSPSGCTPRSPPIRRRRPQLRVGLSIGVAIFPADGADATTLLNNADAALYRAKADGRGKTRFFEIEMDNRLRERRALQHELRSAVERNELRLHYQPQSRSAAR